MHTQRPTANQVGRALALVSPCCLGEGRSARLGPPRHAHALLFGRSESTDAHLDRPQHPKR
eukprot:10466195-Alexandrium_andersonii.AAC.1